jgi:DNA-binding response OmpR family regulator
MSAGSFDVAVVDINLPHQSGFEITRELAEASACAVIITTARDAVDDRVHGYQCGADIYMVKPVEPEELSAAIIRLTERRNRPPRQGTQLAAWIYDMGTCRLIPPQGRDIPLTRKEAQLLSIMAGMGDSIMSREDLLEQLGDPNDANSRGKLDTMLSRLRAKVIQTCGLKLPLITAHSAGFSLVEPVIRRAPGLATAAKAAG